MNENSRFGEHFRDGQCSLVSFLVCCSSTHGAPRAQPFLKVAGGAYAPAPYGVGATVLEYSLIPKVL